MIDADGYRLNVGLIIANRQGKVFFAKRIKQNAWQFPQGGLLKGEEAESAVFRELEEEVGLTKDLVAIKGYTKNWLRYRLPKKMIRATKPTCIGQKQRWYLLEFLGEDRQFILTNSHKPEFDDWQWVNYWYPLKRIITFKRVVYLKALKELAPKFWQLYLDYQGGRSLPHILAS